jgi:hypothetical protein
MLKFKVDYQAVSAQKYDQRFREREIRYLQRKAVKLGFTLSPSTTPILAVSYQPECPGKLPKTTVSCFSATHQDGKPSFTPQEPDKSWFLACACSAASPPLPCFD